MRGLVVMGLWVAIGPLACGNSEAPSPFVFDNGGSAGSAGAAGMFTGGGRGAASGGRDPGLGAPCVEDSQCNDDLDCTDDFCDLALKRCRYRGVDARCDDGVFCNGAERCQPGSGCSSGDPVTCNDQAVCTIDRCVETERGCRHDARDADGDGDPVWNCDGTDCDDNDPLVSGKRAEICGNGRDDNCNGAVDEPDCSAPQHDTCSDPMLIDGPGSYEVSLTAVSEDFVLSCVEPGSSRRDAVVALSVPDGPALDVDVTATAGDRGLALAAATSCTRRTSEVACAAGTPLPDAQEGDVARVLLHGLSPGVYPLYVSGLSDVDVALRVAYSKASEPGVNETCGTAAELVPSEPALASLVGSRQDLASACGGDQGELVYEFELEQPQDVVLTAIALDENGVPWLSLRSEACTSLADELDCRSGSPLRLFVRALPKGRYFVGVGASGPSDVQVRLELSEPTAAPADQGCSDLPRIVSGESLPIELANHTNLVASACLPGAVDASYALSVEQSSDLLLVERLSDGDTGAVSLMRKGCRANGSLSCETSDGSPVRAKILGVAPGEYAAVVESRLGTPVELGVLSRPESPTTLVALADTCEQAVPIPEQGGRFSGNTVNSSADYEASCDYGGGPTGGAPDQLLKLHLGETRRVVFDMADSQFATMLVVRSATDCPGPEIRKACAPGRSAGRSFLDLTLLPGDYYLQIDGFAGASGQWLLDVYTAAP